MAEQETLKHIIRVANVDLPGNKQLRIALTKIKGIGENFADALCVVAHVPRTLKAGNLSEQQVISLNSAIQNPAKAGLPQWMLNHRREFETGEDKHVITGNLLFVQDNDLKRMKKIKCYKGVRHIQGQPVRGQRTRSNFRKNKGKVVGVVKKKATPGTTTKEDKK